MTTENWTVENILHMYSSVHQQAQILIVPPWKRTWTWDSKHGLTTMQGLIQSILASYPVPAINVIRCGETGRFLLDDGRHRIETCMRFVKNMFPIAVGSHVVYFKDLDVETVNVFMKYKIPVNIQEYNIVHKKYEILRML